MSSTDQTDPAAEPSTDIELAQKVDWLRSQLDTVRVDAERAAMVKSRQLGPLDDWVRVLADYDQLAQTLARTSFVPKDFQGKPDQITAGLMFGREIGIPPVTMMQNMVVIHGRVGMYAEQLRAMILAAGHEYEITESTSDRCEITGRRKGSDRWQTFAYTMDQAKLAGLYAQNEQYRKRPTEMLLARASGIMAHAMFPDVIRGMGAVEELEGQEPDDQPDTAPVGPVAKAPTVQRAPRKKAAAAVTAGPIEERPEVVIPADPALPPLPGEAEPPSSMSDAPTRQTETAAASSGKVRAGQEDAGSRPTPSGEAAAPPEPPTEAGPGDRVHDEPRCPHISNGDQCTWAAGHPEDWHSYDLANRDIPTETLLARANRPAPEIRTRIDAGELTERRCPDLDVHSEHAWSDDEGAYGCLGMRPSAPVSNPTPMHPTQTKALQARFKGLGYTDEPDDREMRLRVVSTILGRGEDDQVETFRSQGAEGGMNYAEAERVMKVLAPARSRDDVLEILMRLSKGEEV